MISKNVKMKKNKNTITFFLLLVAFFSIVKVAYGATTPSPLPSQNQLSSDSADLEKIQKIKDIVASKVAELKLVDKRGIIGTLKDVSGMQLTVVDIKGNKRLIDVDELTKFSFSSKKSAGIGDLEKGDSYSIVGLFNKDSGRLLARNIDSVDSIPVRFEGAISAVDDTNYQLTVVNEKGEKRVIDIQSSTKTSVVSENGDLQKSGFSKLSENERVLATGFWDKKDSNLLSASRIIHFESIPPSKEMQSHISNPTPTEVTK